MADRTQAFDQLTEDYRRFRPDYPDTLLERLGEHVRAGDRDSWPTPWLMLDVGSGTGISTRALRRVFGPAPRVVGVEPGSAMRDTAAGSKDEGAEFVDGRAEEVPFPDSSAVLVLAAQAVHWFDRPAFYAEAARLLAPGGTAAVLNNDRDWTADAFVDAYEGLLEEYGDDYRRDHRAYDTVGEMNAADGLADATESSASWTRVLDPEGFVGAALSSSQVAAVVRNIGERRTRDALASLLAEHFPDGDVRVSYTTRLYLARRQD
ncbi:class I SAM-dependent methyltransferase [Nocardiopsis sp. NPDC058631]|uniref:class I SAM-dependent methyltransferase n=1 Tax=Nocardiopsis sp. NPDC058631 TaxID=3346566 RepID=UPI003654E559